MTEDAQLGASIDLSIDAALGQVQQLGAATEEALTQASSSAAEALAQSANVQPVVAVDADTTAAVEAIDKLTDDAAQVQPVVAVDADTGDAEQRLDDLASSAEEAGTAMEHGGEGGKSFAEGAALASGAAELATGHVGGLKEAVGGIEGVSGGAIAGVAALAAGAAELVHEGLNAESAVQRFNTIVGDLAERVEHVHVGTLSEDLGKLGRQFGSTEAEMQNTTASLVQFARNSGASDDAAVRFANNINALAARAVALNPALGNVADVADSMAVRLARGGRFAANFGIALTSSEVAARASADANGKASNELTIFEKAAAGAQIAAERYGSTIGKDVANGAENAANQQKALTAELKESLEEIGRPLVAPFLDVLRTAIPDVQQLGIILGQLAEAALPVIKTGLDLLVGPLQLVSTLVQGFTDAFKSLESEGTVAGAAIGFAFGGPIGAAIGGAIGLVSDLTSAFDSSGQSVEELRRKVSETVRELEGLGPKAASQAFITKLFGPNAILTLNQIRTAVRTLAEASPTEAKMVADGLEQIGIKAVYGQKGVDAIREAVAKGTEVFKENATQKNAVAEGDQKIIDNATGAASATEHSTQATDDATRAAINYVTALTEQNRQLDELENRELGLPGAQLDFAESQQRLADATQALNDARATGDPEKIAKAERDVQRAQLDSEQSALRLGHAQADLNETLATGGVGALDAEIARLRDYQRQNPQAADSIQPLIDQIITQRDLLIFLDSLHPHPTTTFTVNGQPDIDAANLAWQAAQLAPDGITKTLFIDVVGMEQAVAFVQLINFLNSLPGGTGEVFDVGPALGVPIVPRAAGGTVGAGDYLVGERGPELLHLDTASSGYVLDAQRTRQVDTSGALSRQAGGRVAGELPAAPLMSALTMPARGGTVPQIIDNSVHTQVDARGQDDPTRIGIAIARRQRADLSARTS